MKLKRIIFWHMLSCSLWPIYLKPPKYLTCLPHPQLDRIWMNSSDRSYINSWRELFKWNYHNTWIDVLFVYIYHSELIPCKSVRSDVKEGSDTAAHCRPCLLCFEENIILRCFDCYAIIFDCQVHGHLVKRLNIQWYRLLL